MFGAPCLGQRPAPLFTQSVLDLRLCHQGNVRWVRGPGVKSGAHLRRSAGFHSINTDNSGSEWLVWSCLRDDSDFDHVTKAYPTFAARRIGPTPTCHRAPQTIRCHAVVRRVCGAGLRSHCRRAPTLCPLAFRVGLVPVFTEASAGTGPQGWQQEVEDGCPTCAERGVAGPCVQRGGLDPET